MMKNSKLIFFLFLLPLLTACQAESPTSEASAEIIELNEYETIVAFEENILATPKMIRYDDDSTLLVYDAGKASVIEINDNGEVIQEFGRRGRGPGEFQRIRNMILTDDHIYIVDRVQFLIHKYTRNGELISSFDYGALGAISSRPPAPFINSVIRAEKLINQPFVTTNGNVMISFVDTEQPVDEIYRLVDWEGNHLANIGEVPEGSTFNFETERFQADVAARMVPAYQRPYAFPVEDISTPGQYFLIYNSLQQIIKYDSSGQQLWVSRPPATAEVDSITNRYFERVENFNGDGRMLPSPLDVYRSGVSSDGELYLALTYLSFASNTLWIHRFDTTGELTHRYKLMSEDVELHPIFDVDVVGRRIFVVTDEAEIRAYSF